MLAVRRVIRILCVAVAFVASSLDASAQVRVRAVDLFGAPIAGVDVRIEDRNGKLYPLEENRTDGNGIATIGVEPVRASGRAKIRINMAGKNERVTTGFRNAPLGFVGRVKRVNWSDKDEFNEGFAVPLWAPGDVKSLAGVVIRNPTHLAVAVQLGANNGAGSRVIAEIDQDVDAWIANVVPDLPQIEDPYLARAMFAQTDPGEILPPHFDEAMSKVFAEVQRQNDAARVCRMFPQGAAQPQGIPRDDPIKPPTDVYYPPNDVYTPPTTIVYYPPAVVCPPPTVVHYPPPEKRCGLLGLLDYLYPKQTGIYETGYRYEVQPPRCIQQPGSSY